MPRSHGTTAQRGYGQAHTQARRTALAILAEYPGQPCHHCARPMYVGMALDLDHTPTRDGYRGLCCASCNRADGARRGNRARRHTEHAHVDRRW